jgi:hypothetical protein
MDEIIAHPWMQGEHATHEQVKQEFAIRHYRMLEDSFAFA